MKYLDLFAKMYNIQPEAMTTTILSLKVKDWDILKCKLA